MADGRSQSTARVGARLVLGEDDLTAALLKLGGVIRQIRKEKDLLQEEVALRAGLHDSYISVIEQGARRPSWTTILKICHALEVPLIDLVKRVEEQNPPEKASTAERQA